MNSFSRLNVIMGWLMFAISLVVYTLTLEPSVSLWDCGEFASAAYKLQVVHPPGAPLFLMIGRIFSLFASTPENVGFWVNMLSAVSSAGCVMFTFWITTMFANKLVSDENKNKTILVIGAGIVAALTNTFLDSFWFSAVEAEVYAMSSFFTSLTFWALLRWYTSDDSKIVDRWIVFIGFMIGLALGTHMLNLLVIPTVCLAYYFKKYKVTPKGVLMALIGSGVALGFVMKIIYPGIPWLLANLDKMFVNGFGLPFYSGAIVAIGLIVAAIVYLLIWSHKKGSHNLNVIILSAGFIIFGYSSYAMVVIRSMANPAIDMNNPEDPFKFYGYITREQYGDRPLLYGPYFNAPATGQKEKPRRYFKSKDRYEEGDENIETLFEPMDIDGDGRAENFNTIFPRMGSMEQRHFRGYREMSGMDEVQGRIDELQNSGRALTEQEKAEIQMLEYTAPSFGNNMKFFFTHQIRYMYLRYFAWNFIGRMNDQQAVSGNGQLDGNWYSGISFIDNINVGPMKDIPEYYQNQKAKNAFFFLPLILGILGLAFQYGKKKHDFWLVMTMFVFTGLLIIIYTNQPPTEPRERDYAVVGSFQIFCIWIGLGVISLAEILSKYLKGAAAIGATALSLVLVPLNMGYQNWDDHDRSGRYIGIDMAKNFLGSLEKNAVLFCNGDNDTYPLWYAQNVEGYRTDVRIINQSLLPTDWYSMILKDTVYESMPLPLSWKKEDLQTGSFESPYGIQINNEEYPMRRELSTIIKEMQDQKAKSGDETKGINWNGSKFFVKVDKQAVLANGIVSPSEAYLIEDTIKIDIASSRLSKGDLVMYDLIATMAKEGWKRPIYFTSVSGYDFGFLNNYLQLEGLVYRFVPIKGGADRGQPSRIQDFKLYNNLAKRYKYYGMKDKKNFFLDDKAAYVPNDLQQMTLLLANYYMEKINGLEQMENGIKTGTMDMNGQKVPMAMVTSPVKGFASATDYYNFYKDSIANYRKRGIDVLSHILKEIPQNVLPMRREYRTEYGVAFLALGDEKNAKEILDASVKENVAYAKFYKKLLDKNDNNQVFARELNNSQYFINRAIEAANQKNKMAWSAEYKRLSAGLF